MSGAAAAWLSGGRLHLQHGPIDAVLSAEGPGRAAALAAARARFPTILPELVAELGALRRPLVGGAPFAGPVARGMARAVAPYGDVFVTPMAAVAGAVADALLAEMIAFDLTRAYVNDGGDIALHLAPGARYCSAMMRVDGAETGRIDIGADDGVGGIATSGRHGRSLSLGIADSVTVLAHDAAAADVAATLIANAVDLPGHPAIRRLPAIELDPDSDLGPRPVVTGVAPLDRGARARALAAGRARAEALRAAGRITAASLTLGSDTVTTGPLFLRRPAHA
ncbi:UPF0280 family protein [Jannaschia seohaensis]|uniref:Uncharacterized protein n=1 Tax=Jannaschia seohaensis TaxID=475081 RepID=A0A2Y9AAK7_9RHOB|nr:hypothetical protein [Jannaschia seohaensis]PWJ21204.1 hypothetical protein BCF38_102454 [Jannaschia seohaensis]SSA41614.1 hypothetical protein SAMN05421539_102454 [Jannaschia seohaensis]